VPCGVAPEVASIRLSDRRLLPDLVRTYSGGAGGTGGPRGLRRCSVQPANALPRLTCACSSSAAWGQLRSSLTSTLRRAAERASDYHGEPAQVCRLRAPEPRTPTVRRQWRAAVELRECQPCGIAQVEPKGIEPSTSRVRSDFGVLRVPSAAHNCPECQGVGNGSGAVVGGRGPGNHCRSKAAGALEFLSSKRREPT
jgi:hypothetical protein